MHHTIKGLISNYVLILLIVLSGCSEEADSHNSYSTSESQEITNTPDSDTAPPPYISDTPQIDAGTLLQIEDNFIHIDGRTETKKSLNINVYLPDFSNNYSLRIVTHPEFGQILIDSNESITFNSGGEFGTTEFEVTAIDSNGRESNIVTIEVVVGTTFNVEIDGLPSNFELLLFNQNSFEIVGRILATKPGMYSYKYVADPHESHLFRIQINPFIHGNCEQIKSTYSSYHYTTLIQCSDQSSRTQIKTMKLLNLICVYNDIPPERNVTEIQQFLMASFSDIDHSFKTYWLKSSYGKLVLNEGSDLVYLPRSESEYPENQIERTIEVRNDCISNYANGTNDSDVVNFIVPVITHDFPSYSAGEFTMIGISMFSDFRHQLYSVLPHELGHSFGFPHSISNISPWYEYGNPYDVMSYVARSGWYCELGGLTSPESFSYRSFNPNVFDKGIGCGRDDIYNLPQDTNSLNKFRAGWLDLENFAYIDQITSESQHSIYALALHEGSYPEKAVIVALSDFSWLLIESRLQVGIDESLPAEAVVIYKVDTLSNGRIETRVIDHLRDQGDEFLYPYPLNGTSIAIRLDQQLDVGHLISIYPGR